MFDLRGPQPLIAGSGLEGDDPEWSPDGRRLVFRSPSEPHKGHSLFVVDVGSNSVSRLTSNESDDVHHVALRWLAGNDRLMYSVVRIEELEGECGGFPHAQVQRSNVPHAQLHIADVGSGESMQLPYSGFVLGSGRHGDLDFSPDGRYLFAVSYPSYWLGQTQGSCPYESQDIPRFHIYDLNASTQQALVVIESHGYGGLWSPDSRHLAHYRSEPQSDGSLDSAPTIRDMRVGSEWTLEPPVAPDEEAWLSFDRWSPDGSRLLLRHYRRGSRSYYSDIELVAVPETERLIRLDFPREEGSSLTFGSFSADGLQVLRTQRSFYSEDIGTLYINDIGHDGALLGTFNTFAATEPSSTTRIYLDSSGAYDEYFDMTSVWTPEGIFAASYFYWQPYTH